MQQLAIDDVASDLAGAVATLRAHLPAGAKVGAVGYCWGGAIADLAACRTDLDAAVSYYGRANVAWLDEQPRCPILYHFGAKDPLIPPEIVAQIRNGRPGAPVYVYPDAGHGFSCDERPEFHEPSHRLALERTLAFFWGTISGTSPSFATSQRFAAQRTAASLRPCADAKGWLIAVLPQPIRSHECPTPAIESQPTPRGRAMASTVASC